MSEPAKGKRPVFGKLRSELAAMFVWMLLATAACAQETAPRVFKFDLTVGMKLRAGKERGWANAGSVLPMNWPEQKVELISQEIVQCTTSTRIIPEGGTLLLVRAKQLEPGSEARAIFHYRVEVTLPEFVWTDEDFPSPQPPPDKNLKVYLGNSPGIQATDPVIRKLADEIAGGETSEWKRMKLFHEWISRNVKYQVMSFTSAKDAAVKRVGDCEERTSLFIALCRASGIPARTVFSPGNPGHCWAECHLVDSGGLGRWAPVDSTVGSFGFLPGPQIVMQKGDYFEVPEKGARLSKVRSLFHWFSTSSAGLQAEFIQDAKAVVEDGSASSSPALK